MLLKILQLFVAALLLVTGIATAGQGIWQEATPAQAQAKSLESGIHYFSVDHVALRNTLSLVPHKASGDFSQQIELPMPDGSLARFRIVESPIMAPALAARYPEMKAYKVFGIDDQYASGRVNITSSGFSGMLHTSRGRVFIDLDYASDQANAYVSRYRSSSPPTQKFSCGVSMLAQEPKASPVSAQKIAHRTPGKLLVYKLAIAATEEYVSAVYNPILTLTRIEQAQNAIYNAIVRVNVIYERDLGIKLILVKNDGRLIEDGGNVSFSNYDATRLLEENQDWLDLQLLSSDYDIGHVFSTGAGGLASLGSTCDDRIKAKGVSGSGVPLGDPFYIDLVAHEIGHQFNAEHSFNGTTLSCGPGRNAATAFEPGSGSTIMAYAGICGVENIQAHSDATFHAGSIVQIDSFTRGAGSCGDPVDVLVGNPPINNSDPTIATIANKVIPANTPFVLDGEAEDIDPMPVLTYQWDQMDAGCPTDPVTYGTDIGSNALFRSYQPREDSARNFPAMGTQIQGLYDDAEVLPCNNRDLDFRLTVRDGLSGQGSRNVRVSVRNTAGPFKVTNLDVAQTINNLTDLDITWDVAGTDLAPVNCANVDIDLLTFSDTKPKYSVYSLLPNTPNIGMATVTINPTANSHPRARVRVKCRDNIFYDVSDADLAIVGTGPKFSDTTLTIYFNDSNGTVGSVAPACGVPVECALPVVSNKSSGRGSGAIDTLWLLMITVMIALV